MSITWSKSWSSSDDGTTLTGTHIGTLQSDIAGKFSTGSGGIGNTDVYGGIAESKITFAGTGHGHTGGTDGKAIGGSKHIISRGFEVQFASVTSLTVSPGTLYHNTTEVNKTANTTLTLSTDSDWIDGSAPTLTSDIFYVYVDSSGNIKLDENSPDYADTSANTTGTLYYYKSGSTYYRCIMAFPTDSNGQILKYYQRGNWVIFDEPTATALQVIDVTNNVTSWTAASCSAVVPTISTNLELHYLYTAGVSADTYLLIRPTGSSATTGRKIGHIETAPGLYNVTNIVTNSSQSFDYQAYFGNADLDGFVSGYQLNIR